MMRGNTYIFFLKILVILALFLMPYFLHLKIVGSFPSENVNYSLFNDRMQKLVCLDRDVYTNNNIPSLSLTRKLNKTMLDDLDSIYYREDTNTIYAIDKVSALSLSYLNMLVIKGYFAEDEFRKFDLQANSYFQKCQPLPSDQGVTEVYWATKGTSSLHHWVHLYTSGLEKGRAQYGYAITWITNRIQSVFGINGPTNFVRTAWLLFALVGIAYIFLFLYIFRHAYTFALDIILLKTFLFLSLGELAILLAPGFHWFREFVVVLMALCFTNLYLFPRCSLKLALSLVIVCLSYLIDPTFFFVSLLSIGLSVFWMSWTENLERIKSHKKKSLLMIFLIMLAGYLLLANSSGNLSYVLDKIRYQNHGLFVLNRKHMIVIVMLVLVSLIYLNRLKNNTCAYLKVYFSFISLFGVMYYIITPDDFHFIKYLEYSTPLLACLYIDFFNKYGILLTRNGIIRPIKGLVFVIFLFLCLIELSEKPADYQLRVYDSYGDLYFNSKQYKINGRIINADISEKVAIHLENFPKNINADFILSPFDKYLTFLYDVGNGFSDPDFVALIDSNQRQHEIIDTIFTKNKKTSVLLDESIFLVNPKNGIKKDNTLLGGLSPASLINTKAQLRAKAVGEKIVSDCNLKGSYHDGSWKIFECNLR